MFNFNEHIQTSCAEERTEIGNTKISEVYKQIGSSEFVVKTGIYTICGNVNQWSDGGYTFAGTCVIGSSGISRRLWDGDACIADIVYKSTEAAAERSRLGDSLRMGAWASVGITVLLAALSLRCAGFL